MNHWSQMGAYVQAGYHLTVLFIVLNVLVLYAFSG